MTKKDDKNWQEGDDGTGLLKRKEKDSFEPNLIHPLTQNERCIFLILWMYVLVERGDEEIYTLFFILCHVE